jgi:cleavage stimulation factor subunit 2
MWNNTGAAPMMGHYGQPPPAQSANNQASGGTQPKHDIFVGNLAFNTTEEQLYQAFSELGRIIKVRMVSDQETGKPRGFAFIEFEDPQAALSAIRNMNEYEINGRKIRVNFSNSSHLETLAGQMGMDLSHVTGPKKEDNIVTNQAQGGDGTQSSAAVAGSRAVASALKSMNKGEMYDVVAKLKEIADSNPEEARKILTQHPQLPEAILYCMSELDMIKTPVATSGIGVSGIGVPLPAPAPAAPSDPRARALPPQPLQLSDPRARPADPRAAARDPRAAAPNFPPPPTFAAPPSMPPPPMPPQQGGVGVAGLDPNLVQQVMQLTPSQIAQLPPDKQQSILALRQQITGAGLR